jgi:hypothetical protein
MDVAMPSGLHHLIADPIPLKDLLSKHNKYLAAVENILGI